MAEADSHGLAGVQENSQIERGCMRWYVVFCKLRQELIAQENLVRQRFQVYLPRIRVRQRRRNQWTDAVEILFPRYLFIRIDPLRQSTATVHSTYGAIGLVRFGGQPAVVPDGVIGALLHREEAGSGLHQDDRSQFRAGAPIRLVGGPFADVEGIFVQEDGEKRAIVLLEFLGKSNKVKVNRDWVAKAT